MATVTRRPPTYDITGLTEEQAIGIAHFIGKNCGEFPTTEVFCDLSNAIGWERYLERSDKADAGTRTRF